MYEKPTYEDLEQKIKILEKAVMEAEQYRVALKQSEEKFRILADLSPAAIMLYQDGRWIYANQATETIFGYSAKELLRMNSWDIAHPDFKAFVQECGQKFERGEETTYRYEVKIIRRDGSEKWVDLTGASTMIGKRPVGIISVTDINDRKRAEEERYHYEKLHGVLEMAGAVCHELNQPMQIISGYSEMLLKDTAEDDPVHIKVDKINKQIRRMSTITKKLMRIKDSQTEDYAGFSRIININKSSDQESE
jgi:PAS domain S-box-containing protein